MNVVSAVIVMALAVIGLAAVFRELSLRLFCTRDDGTVMYITNIKTDENVEFALRSVLSRRRWSSESRGVSVVCLSCALDDKTRKICEGICREYGFDGLMTKDEFLKSLD